MTVHWLWVLRWMASHSQRRASTDMHTSPARTPTHTHKKTMIFDLVVLVILSPFTGKTRTSHGQVRRHLQPQSRRQQRVEQRSGWRPQAQGQRDEGPSQHRAGRNAQAAVAQQLGRRHELQQYGVMAGPHPATATATGAGRALYGSASLSEARVPVEQEGGEASEAAETCGQKQKSDKELSANNPILQATDSSLTLAAPRPTAPPGAHTRPPAQRLAAAARPSPAAPRPVGSPP